MATQKETRPWPGDLISWRYDTGEKGYGILLAWDDWKRPKMAKVFGDDGLVGDLELEHMTLELKGKDLVEAGRFEATRRKVTAE
jgi:hypothetical protein